MITKIESKTKAKILITPKLAAQITCLHNQCVSGKEWSGLLVSQITKGGIEDLENLEITCYDVFLMDFGDATFTSFEGNEDWIKFFKQFPQIDPLKREANSSWFASKIHSHHSMSSFHSGVDTQDLYENAPKLPFFLSLVVNYACIPFAEIGIAAEEVITEVKRSKWKLLKWKGGNKELTTKKVTNVAVQVVPCDVVYTQEAWFINQIEAIKSKENKVIEYENNPLKNYYGGSREYNGPSRNSNVSPTGSRSFGIYTSVLNDLADLLTFGNHTSVTTPFKALEYANNHCPQNSSEEYKSAFKEYFMNHWFDEYYFQTTYSEEEVITAILEFIEHHNTLWIYQHLKTVLNELKTEYKQLQKIQRSELVW